MERKKRVVPREVCALVYSSHPASFRFHLTMDTLAFGYIPVSYTHLLGSSFAALFGVLPNTSFSQNVGLVSMTKVVNRFAISIGAISVSYTHLVPIHSAALEQMYFPELMRQRGRMITIKRMAACR